MSRLIAFSAVGLAAALCATPVSAQMTRPERPYRGLFASGIGGAGQVLAVNVSLAGGWDNDLLADATGQNTTPNVDGADRSGVLGQFGVGLNYSLQTDRATVGGSIATSGRYYPDSDELIQASSGSLSLGVGLGARTRLAVAAGVTRQPFVFQSFYPAVPQDVAGVAPRVDPLDLATSTDPYTSYDGTLQLSQQVSRRISASVSYVYRQADDPLGSGSFVYQDGGAGLTFSIAKGLGVRAGYRYGEAEYADGRRRPLHGLDLGADYNRALSISRRTTLSFGTGSMATRNDQQLQYTFTGNATLNHEIGRTWNLFGSFGRQLVLSETLQEPIVADGLTTGFGGLISRRLQFSVVAQAAMGSVGVQRSAPGFDSAQAAASLNYALARYMNLGVTYAYYRHRFDAGVALPAGVLSTFDRHTVRANVSLWAPLMQRARRNNASR